MSVISASRIIVLALIVSLVGATANAQSIRPENQTPPDQTLSPYFFIPDGDPETDRLPLKSTHVDARIDGVIADVAVTQVYANEGKRTLEAVYVFPGSTRAAVYAMTMTVGDRVIEAEIMKRQKARETYEKAKQEGKTASLLEQQRPNVFQMNVANILPGDRIEVELRYTELIEPEDQVYEFVYPAVVGPRYSNQSSEGADETDRFVETPYLGEGQGAPYEFKIRASLSTGVPLADLSSPSTIIDVARPAPNQARVTTDDPEAGRKDFVLRYRLAGGRIQTGLLLSPGEDENHFLMLMEPPRRVKPDEVPPREYVFVVDVSGSMNGFPLEDVGKPLMREMIRNLRPNDYMNLMLFAGGSEVLSERGSLAASEANKQKAVRFLESRHGGGGTEILPALRRAMKLPQTEGVSRIVVVVTDGFVHVEAEAFELIRKHLDRANLFAFGIGSSVNRFLIEGMARAGWGRPFVALNPNQGVLEARKFKEYISSPVLTDVAVRFQGFRAYDVEPLAVPDLFASRPITLIGKYKGGPEGQIEVTGRTGGGEFRRVVAAESAQVADSDRAIGLLWARKRIQRLADMNRLDPKDDRIDQVTNLGLEYGLMTQYTSFVAVDKVKRADGTLETVKQPLPLPVGVSDQAVGGRNKAGGLGMARTMVKRAAPALEADQALVREQPPAPKPEPKDKKAESPAPSTLTHDRLTLTIGEVRGGLDRGDLSRTLRPLMPHMDGCFGPSGGGQLTLRLIWNENGRLDRIEAVNTASGLESARRCLEGALKGLKLESDGGAVAVLSFTI